MHWINQTLFFYIYVRRESYLSTKTFERYWIEIVKTVFMSLSKRRQICSRVYFYWLAYVPERRQNDLQSCIFSVMIKWCPGAGRFSQHAYLDGICDINWRHEQGLSHPGNTADLAENC